MSLRSPCLCYAGQEDFHGICSADVFFKILKSKNDNTFLYISVTCLFGYLTVTLMGKLSILFLFY